MTEATWGDRPPSNVDWRMSAGLGNDPHGDADLAEVTSLEGAVQAWLTHDGEHREAALLRVEHGVLVDRASATELGADGIAKIAEHLLGRDRSSGSAQVDDAG